ncbi:MAG: acyloxyacyl hydrolase [Alphaproteobacteria bacterium]|nr:acyloxyacyl hydrolase [Alphaproteobacteria bacterium]
MTATVVAVPAPARADDPAFVTLAAGWFDVNRQKNEAAEFRLEYRHDQKFWIFKPFAGAMGTSDGASYYYAGILVDVYLGNRVVVTPSFAPGYYAKGSGYDLGHEVEFRSQLELAYRFDDRSRLGISFGHMSNAGLGDKNPGTESLMVNYSIPLGAIVNMFGGK